MNDRFKTFILLAQYKSFTETAKHLFCSQPTVTQHIQQLETEYNCKLISRNKRQIELTPQGELVLEYAKKVERLERELHQSISEVNYNKNVDLYLSQYIAENYFDELFDESKSPCQNCPFQINSFCYQELKGCLFDNRAKFAVMPIYEADDKIKEKYHVEVLFEEELVLVMPKNHPLAQRKVLYTRDLKNLSILVPQSNYLSEMIKQSFTSKKVSVHYIQMTNFEIIKRAIKQGLGLSFLPLKTFESDLDNLVYKKVKGLTLKRKNGIVYNPNKQLTDQEEAFCEHIKKKLKAV